MKNDPNINKPINLDLMEGFKNFYKGNLLKKAILLRVATSIPDQLVEELKQIFTKLDKTCNGTLSYEEWLLGYQEFLKLTDMDLPEDI